MSFSRIVFIGLSIAMMAGVVLFGDMEKAIAVAVVILLAASMLWFNSIWANYILRFGFLESLASDFKSAEQSSAAIALLGWLVLLLTGLLLLLN